ncbi:dihydroneopterin aldolase [Alkalimonas collagenimarina]|uniref:7,8-dihydroneopterin aldolase n=1 Tax=Alkalimonas collagenimarina TaxID=400390 RepID=A0ABT9GZ61_9GAMM|nr:dihydroneopterin aldolase [Alkalimonas collagenimarina]MDP4536154.1 dihydroneopterin aldolase [Alkalimonas collagenimarina]
MDSVFIKKLCIDTVIGVYEWEKAIQQRLELDLELSCNTAVAAAQDDIRQALDYSVIAQQVTDLVTAEPIELIETVAERVATLLLANFSTDRVQVTVHKPGAVPTAQTVGVRIVRERS